ncbi:hypothetical protein WR25_11761 [Diploscapter pachys]|uniref:Olfactomedin-like domain-containing protein n=1 Tax=Diploscapter pachys TaxID=2018661 RepID=A0A2A2JX12_9BILA|nr:hypothetical protein WR25_11761 [Diploscapter pachys]
MSRTVLLLVLLVAIDFQQVQCLFGLFGGGSKAEVIHKDEGELPSRSNADSHHGRDEIDLKGTAKSNDDHLGDKVDIPLNKPSTTERPRFRSTTSLGRLRTTTEKDRDDWRHTDSFTATPRSRKLPINEERPDVGSGSVSTSFSGGCPQRVDAYASTPNKDYLFNDKTVYIILNNRIVGKGSIKEYFPNGPNDVNAAVYDDEKEWLVLIKEKSAYAYKAQGLSFKLDSNFPKELPSNIAFTPYSAIRWHDTRQLLLSNGGQFALYDEYWNKSLMSGRTMSYFEGLPDKVKGMSRWKGGDVYIFTPDKVYQYDKDKKEVTDSGTPLNRFLSC